MTLIDYQWQIAGLLLGAGTDYIIHTVTGLGIPAYRTSDTVEPLRHGVDHGHDLLEARTLVFEITVRGDTPQDVVNNIDALREAWFLDTRRDQSLRRPISFKLPGQVARRFNGRPRRIEGDLGRVVNLNVPLTLEYVAGNPRQLSDAEKSVTITYDSAGATGYAYPRGYPRSYGGTSSSNSATANNEGAVPTSPVIRIDGPCVNPQVENVTSERILSFDIDLDADDYLEIDVDRRSVLLNGSTNRFGSIDSAEFFDIEPGANTIKFVVAGTSGAPTAQVTWRDAWV